MQHFVVFRQDCLVVKRYDDPLGDGAGELFQKRVLEKIRRIRKLNGRIHILVDGGVDPEIMEIAVEAGADMIVMGRAVFGSPDPEAFLREHSCG